MSFFLKKNSLVCFFASLLLLLTLGTGTAIVYSDYVYTPNKGFTFMNITSADPDQIDAAYGAADPETMEKISKEGDALAEDLDRWAEEHHASILIRNIIPMYPHISVSIHSDLKSALKIEKVNEEASGLYIEKEVMSDPYLSDNGVFLPDQYHQTIEGVYDKTGLPRPLQQQGYYLLSLKEYSVPEGTPYIAQLYTDAEDMDTLRDVLKDHQIGISNLQRDETSETTRLKKLFDPIGFYNGVLLLTLSATIGGVIFLTLIQFRDIHSFRIRHLNGKPLYRIVSDTMLSGLVLFAAAYGILLILLPRYCSYMQSYDMIRIRISVGVILFMTVLAAYGMAAGRLLIRLRRR